MRKPLPIFTHPHPSLPATYYNLPTLLASMHFFYACHCAWDFPDFVVVACPCTAPARMVPHTHCLTPFPLHVVWLGFCFGTGWDWFVSLGQMDSGQWQQHVVPSCSICPQHPTPHTCIPHLTPHTALPAATAPCTPFTHAPLHFLAPTTPPHMPPSAARLCTHATPTPRPFSLTPLPAPATCQHTHTLLHFYCHLWHLPFSLHPHATRFLPLHLFSSLLCVGGRFGFQAFAGFLLVHACNGRLCIGFVIPSSRQLMETNNNIKQGLDALFICWLNSDVIPCVFGVGRSEENGTTTVG